VTVALDIRNAFNSISWPRVLDAIGKLNTPDYLERMFREYFTERTAEDHSPHTPEGSIEVCISGGVSQGSVVGPLLWNLIYDDVLRLGLPPGAELFGFADDTLVVAASPSITELEATINESLARVSA